MIRFNKSRLILWAITFLFIFVLLDYLIPTLALLTILNGVFLGVVVAVTIVYSPLVWYTINKRSLDRVSQLSFGIGLLWMSIAAQKLWWSVFHYYGEPDAWRNSTVSAAISFLAIIGGCLFVTAPGYPPETSLEAVELWGGNRKLLLTLGAIGGTTAFILSIWPGIRI